MRTCARSTSPATTNPGGAGKWRDEYSECFSGADVVVIPDNDDAGRNHAAQVAHSLTGIAARVRVLDLAVHWPGCPSKCDVSDLLDTGQTREQLDALIDRAPDATTWVKRRKLDGSGSTQPSSEKIAHWDDPDWSILDDRRGELPEFPINTLSPSCQQWAQRAAHGAGVTAAHVAIPLIGIASSLIGTARRVQASRSFTQPMTCWAAIVGFSGTGKTPGIDATKRALWLVERNRKENINDMRRAHETRRETAKAMRDAWTKQLKDIAADNVVDLQKYRSTATAEPAMPKEAEDPGPFVAPKLYVSNATIERLAQILQVQPQGALLLSDELAGLFLNMSRYSGGQDNEFWLEAWNGGHYTVERMSRPAVSIDRLLIGVVGGMQPDKLARSFAGDSDGMSARFLYAWPPEPGYKPLSNDVAEVEPEIVNALTRLVELPFSRDKDEGAPGPLYASLKEVEFAPRAVPLSSLAAERFEQFRQFVHAGKASLDGREREWWAKMPAHALRLAGTLCFLEWAFVGGQEPTEIDAVFMQAAVHLVRDYFWPHGRAALRQIGLTERHATERRVLRWIAAHKKAAISLKDVRRDALGQSLDAEHTAALLDRLEKAGWLRKGDGKPVGEVGWPPDLSMGGKSADSTCVAQELQKLQKPGDWNGSCSSCSFCTGPMDNKEIRVKEMKGHQHVS